MRLIIAGMLMVAGLEWAWAWGRWGLGLACAWGLLEVAGRVFEPVLFDRASEPS